VAATSREKGGPPVVILGVSRSGTTLLKEMLDHHPALAIPSESYFIPQLWDRHGLRPRREAFAADLARLARLRDWGVEPVEVARRLDPRPTFAEAIAAVYEVYAARQGKRRFGDKTPAYMQRLDAVEQAFPRAQYVHLIRDGRDAALSFVAMRRRPRFNWARPRSVAGFAAQWRYEIGAARRLGERLGPSRYVELRYEELVARPEEALRELCRFLGLDFDSAMLEYHRAGRGEVLVDHPKLASPPTRDLRRWRSELPPRELARFEAIAGGTLSELGYERGAPSPGTADRVRAALTTAAMRARIHSWHPALKVIRRLPVWRLRQVFIRKTARGPTP
jgi:LPS sulfotransferase NodH